MPRLIKIVLLFLVVLFVLIGLRFKNADLQPLYYAILLSKVSRFSRAQIVSAAFLFPDIGFVGRILKATVFRRMIPDMAGMEAEVSQSDLDWTVVRPPRFTNGPITDAYQVLSNLSSDRRQDVCIVILRT